MSNHGHGETIQCNKLVIISWPANINHRITGVLISKHGKIKSSNRSYWASRVTVLVLYRYSSIFNTFYSTGFLIHLFDFRVLVFGFNEYFLNIINFSLIRASVYRGHKATSRSFDVCLKWHTGCMYVFKKNTYLGAVHKLCRLGRVGGSPKDQT